MPTFPRLILSAALAAALVACGSSGGGTTASETPDATTTDGAAGTGASMGAAGATVEGELDAKPTITIPEGDPPAELVTADIVVGDGEEATAEATVTAHYVGQSWSTGEEFDASWNGGEPIPFPLNGVIPGWTQGIPGMKVGGRRLLVIPPDLAYGDSPPPGIAPGETLVFVVDLVDVQ